MDPNLMLSSARPHPPPPASAIIRTSSLKMRT